MRCAVVGCVKKQGTGGNGNKAGMRLACIRREQVMSPRRHKVKLKLCRQVGPLSYVSEVRCRWGTPRIGRIATVSDSRSTHNASRGPIFPEVRFDYSNATRNKKCQSIPRRRRASRRLKDRSRRDEIDLSYKSCSKT